MKITVIVFFHFIYIHTFLKSYGGQKIVSSTELKLIDRVKCANILHLFEKRSAARQSINKWKTFYVSWSEL